MNYWLVKSEPETFGWAQFVKDGRTAWTGVRNYQSRNNLRAMKVGDALLFYHSGKGKEIVGLARVVKAAYPDPTAKDGDWVSVDLAPAKALSKPIPLATIKSVGRLKAMVLVNNTRLSVQPVTEEQFNCILELAAPKI